MAKNKSSNKEENRYCGVAVFLGQSPREREVVYYTADQRNDFSWDVYDSEKAKERFLGCLWVPNDRPPALLLENVVYDFKMVGEKRVKINH